MNLGERIGNSLSCEFLPPSINWKQKKKCGNELSLRFPNFSTLSGLHFRQASYLRVISRAIGDYIGRIDAYFIGRLVYLGNHNSKYILVCLDYLQLNWLNALTTSILPLMELLTGCNSKSN